MVPGEGSFGARLICIQQDGSYTNYVKKFSNYSGPLPEMTESVLMDAFVTGLEPTLQAEVKAATFNFRRLYEGSAVNK